MAVKALTIGPVLSFRGRVGNTWKMTALVGVKADSGDPGMVVGGQACGAPLQLLESGGQRFLRYDLSQQMTQDERRVTYGIPALGLEWSFTVPRQEGAPRIAYVSCNGFSNPDGMRKLVRPENAVWEDLISSHDKSLRSPKYSIDKEQLWHEERIHDRNLQRFHLILMGGDQIYFDSIWNDVDTLKHWTGLSRDKQLEQDVSPGLEKLIERYYFELYPQRWLRPKRPAWGSKEPARDAADVMARIPTIMMWDDHDIFDGWGSYSPEMQESVVFKTLFHHARRAFWVFQLQQRLEDLPELEDASRPGMKFVDPMYKPLVWSTRLAEDPLALPLLDNQPGFTSAFPIGPIVVLAPDLRTERSRTQVLGSATWSAIQAFLSDREANFPGAKHLFFLSSVPVVHPKLTFAEGFLDNFGTEHVLDSNADDLKDHWAHDDHEGERKRLLETLMEAARKHLIRISILSGDVHVAAWGTVTRKDVAPGTTWSQIHQLTSSAVVHPSLMGILERLFLVFLNNAASTVHSLDNHYDITMLIFPGHNRYVMAARNWLALELDNKPANEQKLWATWRCESATGATNHLVTVRSLVAPVPA